jgi:glycosyltransferase involved in cell wall biosynthesis
MLIVDTQAGLEKWVSIGADRTRCRVLPQGVPIRDKPSLVETQRIMTNLELGPESRIFFYIGDISELDGVDILIRSLPTVLEAVPEARALIVGTGTVSYMRFLIELANALEVSYAITFIDKIPHNLISIYGSVASVCVAPFRLTPTSSTTLPNKILEYLALGKPIISSSAKGVVSTLGDKILYASPGDQNSLAESILSCLTASRGTILEAMGETVSWEFVVHKEYELICSQLRRPVIFEGGLTIKSD